MKYLAAFLLWENLKLSKFFKTVYFSYKNIIRLIIKKLRIFGRCSFHNSMILSHMPSYVTPNSFFFLFFIRLCTFPFFQNNFSTFLLEHIVDPIIVIQVEILTVTCQWFWYPDKRTLKYQTLQHLFYLRYTLYSQG